MPMIDIHVPAGLLSDESRSRLSLEAGLALLRQEGAPASPPYSTNAGVYLTEVEPSSFRTVADLAPAIVRFDVMTPPGALTREATAGLVAELDALVRSLVPDVPARSWVLVRETVDGDWGVDGAAPTTAELRALARAAVSSSTTPGTD